jgi:branched-chain amino acid aminotransferase
MAGSQDYASDPRNETAKIYLNGELVAREDAKVSILDAGFVLGDGVWEGLRLHRGALMFLDEHLDRLFWGAEAIGLDLKMSRAQVVEALRQTLDVNQMTDGVHIRLMVTRGLKTAANQDPRNALGRPTVVIIAEHKLPGLSLATRGLSLASVSIRCTPREMFDMRLNSHSRLNLIIALNEAIAADADEALMLDPHGHVASCNATNFFWARDGVLYTSTGDYCFNGVTRGRVIALARENGVRLLQGGYPLEDAQGADEAFVTGTFGGVTPVREIDGHALPHGTPGPLTARMKGLYEALKDEQAAERG